MTRRRQFRSGVVVSGLVALGWLIGPGCGGGSSKPDGGGGAGGHAGTGGHAGAGGHTGTAGAGGGLAGAGGGLAGAGGYVDGGAAGAGANDAGTAGAAAGSTGMAGAGGKGGAAGGSAGSTGTAGTGGKGGAGAGGAAGSSGPCTTSFGAGNKVLYDFAHATVDGGTVDGGVDGWATEGQGNSIAYSATIGHTCPGSVQLSIPGVIGQTADLIDVLLPSADWTGFSKLHIWVKVQTTDYAPGSTLYLYVQANAFADEVANYQLIAGSPFTDGGFHEMVLDLTTFTSAQDLMDVDKIDLSVSLPTAADAGPLAPVTVSIDDVWLEASP
jgi:hypothetical protein